MQSTLTLHRQPLRRRRHQPPRAARDLLKSAASILGLSRRLCTRARGQPAVLRKDKHRMEPKGSAQSQIFFRRCESLRAAAAMRWTAAGKPPTTDAFPLSPPHWQMAPASPPQPMLPSVHSFRCLNCSRTPKQALPPPIAALLLSPFPNLGAAGKFDVDYDSGRPVAPNFHVLLADARRYLQRSVSVHY